MRKLHCNLVTPPRSRGYLLSGSFILDSTQSHLISVCHMKVGILRQQISTHCISRCYEHLAQYNSIGRLQQFLTVTRSHDRLAAKGLSRYSFALTRRKELGISLSTPFRLISSHLFLCLSWAESHLLVKFSRHLT